MLEQKMILDVGCGIHPKGDINCDLYIEPISRDSKFEDRINPKEIPNFVLCDAHFLPFVTNTFSQVVCFDVIEHVENPFFLLKELTRVSSNEVLIKCPHRYSVAGKRPFHVNFFDRKRLTKILRKMKVSYTIHLSWRPIIKFIPFLKLPEQITVHIRRNQRN